MKRLGPLAVLFLVFFVLAAPALSAPAQTYTLTDLGTGLPADDGILSLDFVDADHGWVGAWDGTIRATSDGGATWQIQDSGATEAIFDIQFVDLENGWAASTYGTVLHTSNGGATWEKYTLPGTNRFVDEVEAVAGGTTAWALSDASIYRTTDSGATWTRLSAYQPIGHIEFVDETHGWVAGFSIIATTDGGETWTQQNNFSHFEAISMVDRLHGYAVGQGTWSPDSFKTSDGGATWLRTERMFSNPRVLKYVDENHGWQVTSDGRVHATDDGGQTWAEQSAPLGYAAKGIDVVGDRSWIYGGNGGVLFSDRNGLGDLRPPTTEFVGSQISNAAIPVAFQAVDDPGGSGVAATYYQVDGGDWNLWNPAQPIVLEPRLDQYVVNVYSIDVYGNEEQAHSTTLCPDIWAPVTTLTPASKWQLDYWNNTASRVTVSAVDAGPAGLASVEVSRDKGLTWVPAAATEVTPAPADHSNDGVHPLWARSTDRAGNVEAIQKHEVAIDTRKPTASAPYRASVRRGTTARLKARINDRRPCGNVGHVAIVITNPKGTRRYLTVAPRKWFAVNTTVTVSFTCKLARGTYSFWVWTLDAAGNPSARAARNTLVVR